MTGSLLVALVALCTSCSSSQGNEPASDVDPVQQQAQIAEREGHDDAYQLLRDGDASESDYAESFQRHLACLREAGLTPEEPMLNRVDNLSYVLGVNYGNVDMNDGVNLQSDCFTEYVSTVETAYLATHPAVMDPALLSGTIDCLLERGVELPDQGEITNLAGLKEAAGFDASDSVIDCLSNVNGELYPESFIIIA